MIVKMKLSHESVQKAIEQVDTYADSLETKCAELCERLAEIGVQAAVRCITQSTNGTGELAASMQVEQSGDTSFLVITRNEHAAFVEFGTGVIGSGTYSGELPQGWTYDQRRTPAAHDSADPTKWWYYDKQGRRRSTRGQTATGFMAVAGEEMRQAVLDTAKEVFAT